MTKIKIKCALIHSKQLLVLHFLVQWKAHLFLSETSVINVKHIALFNLIPSKSEGMNKVKEQFTEIGKDLMKSIKIL
jgi:hypothetical protein